MAKTKNLAAYLRKQISEDEDLASLVDNEDLNAEIAEAIFCARKEAGLTQEKLAEAIGTSQSVIARLEDADYDGHSLSMLKRIGRAVKKQIRIDFCDAGAPRPADSTGLKVVTTEAHWQEKSKATGGWYPTFRVESPAAESRIRA